MNCVYCRNDSSADSLRLVYYAALATTGCLFNFLSWPLMDYMECLIIINYSCIFRHVLTDDVLYRAAIPRES